MAYKDRVADTTTTTGNGDLVLASTPPAGYQAPASQWAAGTSGLAFAIVDRATGDFEVVLCTLTSTPALQRDTVLSSSNGGAKVVFGAGIKDVYHDVPASVIDDLIANRALASAVIASGLDPAADQIVLVQSGALKRMALVDFLADLGAATPALPDAAALSTADVLALTQDGVNEVKTTIGDLVNFILAEISSGNATAPGATLTGTASIEPGAASAGVNGTASGATLTGTASITPGSATGGGGASHTITGYSGNAVQTAINAASATVYGSLKHIPVSLQFTDSFGYYNISPVPASARSGWGTSNSTPPAEVTQAANTAAGSSVNGMTPMNKPGAFQSMANLWVSNGAGTVTMYYWVKPVDGAAQCLTPSGVTINNA